MWKLLLHIFILTSATKAVVSVKTKTGCSIKLPNDIKGFAPVILTATKGKYYQLFKPTGQITNLKEGANLLLVCTGNRNTFANTSFDTVQLKCSKGSFVDVNNNVHSLDELVCKSIPISTLKITTDECSGGSGYIYEIGFMIKNQFYGPVIEICYNNVTENTVYTKHILNGAAIKYSIPESTRRPFTADGMQYTTAQTNHYYTKKNQIKRFEELFGLNQIYVNNNNFLARGHLAPDADFIFPFNQLATYYYVNVAPEFQVVNAGNWLRVEKLARAVASSYDDDIDSYNTYMEVLALPKNNGEMVEIYLDDMKKIEAPKFLVKILHHKTSDSAIVFVSLNNPNIKNGKQEEFCTNVCEEAGLRDANFRDIRKGYTFCCNLNEFKRLVGTLPDQLNASKLLKWKNLKDF